MDGRQRLAQLDSSTPRMAKALPDMPMSGTVLVRLLRIAGGSLTDYFEPEFRAMRLTENGFHVLCLLVASEGGAASPSTLSEMIGTSRANMTRILEQLERDHWIVRHADARDGRRQTIAISAAGRRKVDETVPRISGPILSGFAGLDEDDMRLLHALLRKAIVALDHGALGTAIAA